MQQRTSGVTIVASVMFSCSENKWASIDVIYYEYGALVLIYNNAERATRSFNILQDATLSDNKPLLVLLLPNIQVCVKTVVVQICSIVGLSA